MIAIGKIVSHSSQEEQACQTLESGVEGGTIVSQETEGVGGNSLYCGFFRKDWVKQGK